MAVCGIDHQQVDARVDQRHRALVAGIADPGGRSDAEAALRVLDRMGVELGLFDVLDGDQADAAAVIVGHQQLLDPVRVEQALGLVLAHPVAHGDQPLMRHQFGDALVGVGGKAHVAVGEDADETAEIAAALAAVLHHRDAGDAVGLHQGQCIGEGGVGADGDGVHHHAALETLHLPHFLGLQQHVEVLVDHAHATGLRHGDRHAALGDGVHRGREDRDVEEDVLGHPRADIDIGGQDIGRGGLQQHVIERERALAGNGGNDLCQGSGPSLLIQQKNGSPRAVTTRYRPTGWRG